MASKLGYLDILDLRGGQNSADAPMSIDLDQCVEAKNVDWREGTLARKRDGCVSVAGPAMATISSLIRHTPSESEREAELWAVGPGSPPAIERLASGAWSAVTPADPLVSTYEDEVFGASLNGKLFLAYKSAKDRLHVWDGTVLRRAGIAPPAAAPTVANQGSGTYAATKRWYRQRFTAQDDGVTVRRSEPSAFVEFTPSGTGQAARVTMAALPAGETATHWELYASADGKLFYLLATSPLATTYYDDAAAPASYGTSGTPDYEVGDYTLVPSGKYVLTDENRLIVAGSWEDGSLASVLWFTLAAGSGVGDDERTVDQTDWKLRLALDSQDGGGITGLAGPINNCPYVFKLSQIYKLVRTGKATIPYRPVTISKTIGAVRQQAIVEGEDENNNPALYFLSLDGPRRISSSEGLQYLGADLRDTWANLHPDWAKTCHAVYYRDAHQVWFWVAVGPESPVPNTVLVFDTRLGKLGLDGVRRGWSAYTGTLAAAGCSVMFANTLGTTVSIDLKPYIATGGSLKLAKCGTGTDDAGTAFRAYVKTRPYVVRGLGRGCGVLDGTLLAKARAATSIQVVVDRDFGAETTTHSVSLAPVGSETRVIRQIEDLSMAGAQALQLEIGDAAAVSNGWTLEGLAVKVRYEEEK